MKRLSKKNSNQLFKFGDILIALIVLILSFVPTYIFLDHQVNGDQANSSIAYISYNNHLIKKIPLKTGQSFTWQFSHAGEKNTVQVKDKKIRIVDANCNDQICVKQGWKHKNGQTIVCLPHKFLIEIKAKHSSPSSPESKKDFDNTLVNP